jgi:hypothetical protein
MLVSMIRQCMTSDLTISIFSGNLYVGARGHASNTYGIAGECSRAPDSKGEGHQHGVVVYEDGFFKISCPGSDATSNVHFHRLILYHSFYKVVRSMGLEKQALLSCPSKLTLGYFKPFFFCQRISCLMMCKFCFRGDLFMFFFFFLLGKEKIELSFSVRVSKPIINI